MCRKKRGGRPPPAVAACHTRGRRSVFFLFHHPLMTTSGSCPPFGSVPLSCVLSQAQRLQRCACQYTWSDECAAPIGVKRTCAGEPLATPSPGRPMLPNSSVRTTTNFNYGWYFAHLRDDAGPGTCAFEDSLDGLVCSTGLVRNPNMFNWTDCREACCYNEGCRWWQHAPPRYCWHGYTSDVDCQPAAAFPSCTSGTSKYPCIRRGGHRRQLPSPAFRDDRTLGTNAEQLLQAWSEGRGGLALNRALSRASVSNDASSSDGAIEWELVDLPHDYIARNGTITPHAGVLALSVSAHGHGGLFASTPACRVGPIDEANH